VYSRGGNDSFNVGVTAGSAFRGLVLDGGGGSDTVGVFDQSGGAVARHAATAPGQGDVAFSYLQGKGIDARYQNADRCGTSPDQNTSFVQAVYHEALGWNAGPDALGYWLGVMAQGGRAAVVDGILHSGPALAQVVQGWFARYLGHAAGPDAVAYFAG